MKAAQQIQVIDLAQRILTETDARVSVTRPAKETTPPGSEWATFRAGDTIYMFIVAGPVLDVERDIKSMLQHASADDASVEQHADAFAQGISVSMRYHGEIYLDGHEFTTITDAVKHAFLAGAQLGRAAKL